jgi:tRNA G18 (ribose-2'-O)-methylase SpoU
LQRVGYADCASIETTFGTRGQRPFRLVATAITGATPSPDFVFQPRDVIVVGNEYDGLPDSVIEMCDAAVTIPLAPVQQPKPRSFSPIDPMRPQTVAREGTPSLNVAMAAAILLHAAWLQLSER